MKVAALQMVSGTDVAANLRAAAQGLAEAAQAGAELALLPEYFCLLGRHETDKLALAEPAGQGPLQDFLAAQAQRHGLWIAGGTLPLASADAGRVLNSTLVYNPLGQAVARYDKIHLFRYIGERESHDETRTIEAGADSAAFDLPSRDGHTWRVGLSICYDLRFPELYRRLRSDLLLVPSAFTYTTGQAHWDVLLRARAIENLAFVAAAAQAGIHDNGRRTWGHSMLIDPWGQVLAQHAEGPAVVLAELEVGQLQRRRQQLPALDHRVLS
ncbi:MAG: carbon-nitrogen hydrolase family protein [Betaproteobacteria bacterium]